MAIINTLREKMGRLLVVVVGLSIMAFVLTDLVGPQSSILGNNKREVGEIAGEAIAQEEYANYVESIKNSYLQQGYPSSEALMQTVRDQAWDQLIFDIMYQDLYQSMGLTVTSDERVDMVQGVNISPIILQNFGDPSTGTVDRAGLTNYLANSNMSPEGRLNWAYLESQIASNRIRSKYDNLIFKTSYATLAEAQREYNSQLSTVDIDYAYFPYTAIPDSTVTVSDAELRAYLNEHSGEYQVTQSRSIEYVTFPVIPSAADSASYQESMDAHRADLLASEDDSTYALINTEQGTAFANYTPRSLPSDLADNIAGMSVGDVFGPILTNGVYSMYKLSAAEKGETKFVKASHILVKTDNLGAVDKVAARNRANDLLRQVRNGADFDQVARENSDDSSGPSGGDLGWYEEKTGWDAAFEKAVFARTRKGLIPRIVESAAGYHIITIDEVPTDQRYKVANIQEILTPSQETTNQVYREVGEFTTSVNSYKSFTDLTNEKGYSVFSDSNIDPNANIVGSLAGARSIVTWLFGEAELEDVKDFELDNMYVVAVHTGRVAAGTADLENVRAQIETKVKEEKKKELLTTRVSALSGTLQDMVSGFGPTAKFYTTAGLKLNTNSLPNVGTAPEAVGAVFSLANAGDRTTVIGVEFGVVVAELKAKSEAAEIADYTAYENMVIQRMTTQSNALLIRSIRDRAKVTDERYKFY